MAYRTIALDEPTTIDKLLDTESLTVGVNTVERERIQVAGAAALEIAAVKDADPAATLYGLVVRPIIEAAAGAIYTRITDGTDTMLVSAAGNAQIEVAIALPAGAANIGDVDVLTLPALVAGTANIGDVDVLTIAAGDTNIGNVDIVTISEVADGDLPAAAADGAAVRAWFDRHGQLHVRTGAQSAAANAWELDEAPAANTQATETRTAGAAGVRHVATGIQAFIGANGTAPTAAQLDVVLRDGAAGAGTIIWEGVLSIPATAGAVNGLVLTGLWIPGTAATAMTLEFGAAGGAQTFEAIDLQGVDITE